MADSLFESHVFDIPRRALGEREACALEFTHTTNKHGRSTDRHTGYTQDDKD
jgi:hypothetical protein